MSEISGLYSGEYEDARLWDTVTYSLAVDRRFRGVYCLHRQGIAVSTSEKYVKLYDTTRRNIPE